MDYMTTDFSLQNKVTFMKECGITPNEHEVIIGILMSQDEEAYWLNEEHIIEQEFPSHVPDTSYLVSLQNLIGRVELREILFSLQEKGLILKSCKLPDPHGMEGIKPNDIKFNKSVLKKYVRHSGQMFWELFWAYPEAMNVNGRTMSLRNTYGNGGWASVDDAASFYGQRIQYNAETHRQILRIIEEAKSKQLLNMGIIKFLRGEEWKNLENVLSNGFGNQNLDVDFV